MNRINRLTFELADEDGKFLTLVDVWRPQATVEIRDDAPGYPLVLVGKTLITFGSRVIRVGVE